MNEMLGRLRRTVAICAPAALAGQGPSGQLVPNGKRRDIGLLLLRVGVGLLFTLSYGLSKLKGGTHMWALLGGTFNRVIGIEFIPTFWGFMATLSEFGGGLCLVTGVLFRPACSLMLFTMVIAFTANIHGGHGFSGGGQLAFVFGIVFLSLLFTGPGRLTLSRLITSAWGR